MNKPLFLTLLFCIIVSNPIFSQQQEPAGAFLEKWKNSAAYLLEMAETIPESSLDYKPTERQMSVKEQLLHIRSNMLWLGGTYFNPGASEIPERKIDPQTKEELISALKEGFETLTSLVAATEPKSFAQEVEFFAGPKSRLQILNLLQDHVTHHRGQLIVYMNLLDLTPPRYSGW